MIRARKCPKCEGEIEMGKLLVRDNPAKHYDLVFEGAEQKKPLSEKKLPLAHT